MKRSAEGFTLVELVISLAVISVISIGFFSLFIALVSSATVAKQRSVAGVLATNQVEYLRSLPYDSLAVAGGNIVSSSYIPATITKKVNGVSYTVSTTIVYVDDAFDGCSSYPTLELKKLYCRNFSAPGNSSGNNVATDTNPADYKIAHVVVKNSSGARLATYDTQIAARVAETASTTGALFVKVTDASGTPVSEATVSVTNATLAPTVNVADNTDVNGMAIFYGLPPDSGQDYIVKVQKTGYSSLSSISASGSLQPTYASQKILSQQSSYLAMVVGSMSPNSMIIETTDVLGAVLPNAKVYVKGGYKKYTATTNEDYYYDTLNPSDTRPTTNASGIVTLNNLPPIGSYYFCGASGSTSCTVGGSTYYLAAALPYGGSNSLYPIAVPTAGSTNVLFAQDGNNYMQKVRLMLTNNSSFPRVFKVNPDDISLSDNLRSVKIVFTGYNLSNASARLMQNSTTYSDNNCVGNTTQLTCNYDLSTVAAGDLQVSITNPSGTLTLPITPLGGLHVGP